MIGTEEKYFSDSPVPLTEFGIPIRNIWYMLLYAWKDLPINRYSRMAEIENAPTLDALLAYILMRLVQQRLRIGLGCSYVSVSQSIRGVRGRIDFTDSLKHHTFEVGQAICDFDQYSSNDPKNQIIRSTLTRLVQIGQFGPEHAQAERLRHNLRMLTRILDGVDLVELKLDFIRRQQLGRNDGDYRLILAICELILLRHMPTESVGTSYLPPIDRDTLSLSTIYELFVTNFFRVHLKGWNISAQPVLSWHEIHPNQFLPSMKPDLILEDITSGQIIILDTKFTARSLVTNRWGVDKFDSSHLYQIYAYLKSQEHLSDQHRWASGILLYPAINQTRLSESITIQDQTIRIEAVDLADEWQRIEQRLLDVILISRKQKYN